MREVNHKSIPYPGSKRRQEARILPHLGTGDVIVDPTCGMVHIVFRALEEGRFSRAIIGDASPYVTMVLEGIKVDPAVVYNEQRKVAAFIDGSKAAFRATQDAVSTRVVRGEVGPVTAGRILGVLAWTFSRLWRVNGGGCLNATMDPRGRPITSYDALCRLSGLLQKCEIILGPWEMTLGRVSQGDDVGKVVIFADAPYLKADDATGFAEYIGGGWKRADAAQLASELASMPHRVVCCEQDPGGADVYVSALKGCKVYRHPVRRNVRGDQIAKARDEVLIVREAP